MFVVSLIVLFETLSSHEVHLLQFGLTAKVTPFTIIHFRKDAKQDNSDYCPKKNSYVTTFVKGVREQQFFQMFHFANNESSRSVDLLKITMTGMRRMFKPSEND